MNGTNEITSVSHTAGTTWATPAYDAAGSMTTIPKPNGPPASYTAAYDAWNRLVSLTETSTTIAAYEYDGLNRRIVKSVYASGALDHRQHFYYNEDWQLLETRKETGGVEDSDPLEQLVSHPYYVDALLTRFYDANTGGTQVQQYYVQDANFNVTAVIDNTGAAVERYRYTPYGDAIVTNGSFGLPSNLSAIGNSRMYTGRELDAESRLYYYRNRLYHSQLGSFVTRDPLLYDANDSNLYRYVFNNPVNFVDSTGTIGYGNYCGPNSQPGPPAGPQPTNGLDACCLTHDNCYAAAGATWGNSLPFCGTPASQACDNALDTCASNFNCATLPLSQRPACYAARQGIITYF